jgi:hypothetical protein
MINAELRSKPIAIAKVVPKTAAKSPAIMIPTAIAFPLVSQAIFICLSFFLRLTLHVLETMPEESLISF